MTPFVKSMFGFRRIWPPLDPLLRDLLPATSSLKKALDGCAMRASCASLFS